MESKNNCSSTRKIREKAADSWAKKIYEDNHGAFHILMAVVKRIWYLLQM